MEDDIKSQNLIQSFLFHLVLGKRGSFDVEQFGKGATYFVLDVTYVENKKRLLTISFYIVSEQTNSGK